MQADDSADTANRRKTYIKQSGRGMRKSPKRFCLLTFVLIGDAPDIPHPNLTCVRRMSATAASMSAETSLSQADALDEPSRRERKKSAARMIGT